MLAGGVFRKRALQILLVTIVLSLPPLLWVWQVSSHWMQERNSNIAAFAVHGGTSDPALASVGIVGMNLVISLQSIFSAFWNDPHVYNLAAFLTFIPILLVWAFVTLRSRPSTRSALLALASIAALSMLPVYHRQHDAKLLLLTVPACAMLWAEGGLIGRLALLVNGFAFLLTADLLWTIPVGLNASLHPSATGILGKTLTAAQIFPVPIILLVLGIFYLWVYAQRYSPQDLTVVT